MKKKKKEIHRNTKKNIYIYVPLENILAQTHKTYMHTLNKIFFTLRWGVIISILLFKIVSVQTSLVVPWLRLHTPNAGGPRSIPSQGTRFHMLQLKEPACHNKDWRSFLLQPWPVCSRKNIFLKIIIVLQSVNAKHSSF